MGQGYSGGWDQGGYGQGGSSGQHGGQHEQDWDPDYRHWREQQVRKLDDDYRRWRSERAEKFEAISSPGARS